MKHIRLGFILFFICLAFLTLRAKEVKLKIVQTSDIHGNFFPYDFIDNKPWGGSLSRVHRFVEEQRKTYGNRLILLDNGDILQGQPTVYYYNFMDTVSSHVCADMLNFMQYDAAAMGNHDIEAGPDVYNRWISQCRFPILGANILDASGVKADLKPYQVFVRDGVKIAVLGMLTPAIPAWLPQRLWQGLEFADMEETARYWVPLIREKENPDLLIGLFHSGKDSVRMLGKYNDNASLEVARNVPGFDIVMMGHDHRNACTQVVNRVGDTVWIVDPGSNGLVVSDVEITFTLKGNKVQRKQIHAQLTSMKAYEPSPAFMQQFDAAYQSTRTFVDKKIGVFTRSIRTQTSYFGSSAFMDLVHTLQLELTGADISFTAPLSFNAEIGKGDVRVRDMFKLYKYENMLYTMRLTGREVKGFLEASYGMWCNEMKSPDDHLLLLNLHSSRPTLLNYSFNFDSAAGIIYTVDLTKPKGDKIVILSMADGSPFHPDQNYKVALNSYRGNGGGELLTKGAGIAQEELESRMITSTEKDLRFYLMEYIEKRGTIEPKRLNQWKFIPEEWAKPAAARDLELLFGTKE